MLRVHLLGNLPVAQDDQPLLLPRLSLIASLWGYLLLYSGASHPRELLAQTLWPAESEAAARARLRRVLHQLQSSLPPSSEQPWLITTPTTVQWNEAADYWLDVREFELLAANPEQLAEAVAVYAGDLLPGCYDDWAIAERERLCELCATALGRLVQQHRA